MLMNSNEYLNIVESIKQEIRTAQYRATVSVNRELLVLYHSIGEVIKDSMGVKAQRLFTIFALLVLILVIASFTAVVAGTFVSVAKDGEPAIPLFTVGRANVSGNASTATTSLLFIVIAFIFGFFVYRGCQKLSVAMQGKFIALAE